MKVEQLSAILVDCDVTISSNLWQRQRQFGKFLLWPHWAIWGNSKKLGNKYTSHLVENKNKKKEIEREEYGRLYYGTIKNNIAKKWSHFVEVTVAADCSTNYFKFIHMCCQVIIDQKISRVSAPVGWTKDKSDAIMGQRCDDLFTSFWSKTWLVSFYIWVKSGSGILELLFPTD